MKCPARRGQPVISLGLMLVAWVGVRTALLEAADATPNPGAVRVAEVLPTISAAKLLEAPHGTAPMQTREAGTAAPTTATAQPEPAPLAIEPAPLAPIAAPSPRLDPIAEPAVPNPFRGNPRLAGGHQLLWLAALAQLPMPPEAQPSAMLPRVEPQPQPVVRRWSGDAWLLLRRGGSGAGALGTAPASYGASQAGAVIRYHMAPGSALAPKAYLRLSSAVRAPHDEEAAAGLSLRPLAGVPVVAMAELRVTRLAQGAALRPAAMLVSEFPPLPLPGQFKAETYGATGYVGGRFATPFAEGQLRVERKLASFGPAELSAGGGLWGGAQKGASRLDAGPSATLGFPLGAGGGRLSADWRFRLAGSAAPQSGPALTVSAGF